MALRHLVDNWDNYMLILKNTLNITCIVYCIYLVIFSIILVFLFKKEQLKWYYALIPIYNVYHYFKICKLPIWTIFVPFVNLIVFVCSPYCLLKQYQCAKWQCALSIVFPYVLIPFITFNDNYKNKRFKAGYAPFRTVFDIEKIEKNLTNNDEMNYLDYENFENKKSNEVTETYSNKVDEMIDNIENDAVVDQYFDFDLELNNNVDEIKEKDVEVIENIPEDIPEEVSSEEMYEMFDKIDDEDGKFTAADVEKLEEKIEQDNKVEVADTTNYKEYKDKEFSNEAIAFGGEQKIENKTHAKVEELKCSRCGSSLVGAINNTCPGCGAPIN